MNNWKRYGRLYLALTRPQLLGAMTFLESAIKGRTETRRWREIQRLAPRRQANRTTLWIAITGWTALALTLAAAWIASK